jgi:DNA-binding NtrC family response regulator
MGPEIIRDVVEESPRLRVLIVDDEPLIRWSISETLTETGHAVSEACDARETLQRLGDNPAPDVILLDYRLPDSDDLKLLETIRKVAPGSRVVLMTAFSTPAVQACALELGAFRVVSKPFEMSDLTPLVQQAYASSVRDANSQSSMDDSTSATWI